MRHAESEANRDGEAERDSDSPLTDAGRAQAEALAEAFEETPVDALWSSDTLRAIGTLAPLAARLGQPVQPTVWLREPHRATRPTQMADASAAAALLEALRSGAASSSPPARTETHADVIARLRRWLNEPQALAAGSVVVVCSHYVTLHTLVRLWIATGEPPAALWAHFDNASVTRVDLPAHRLPPTGRLMYQNGTSFSGGR